MKKQKTNWFKKNKAVWIGAIIGGIIGLFIFFSNLRNIRIEWLETILMFIAKLYVSIIGCKQDCYSVYIVLIILIMLFGTSIGALIGFIVGKIKKKINS